MMETKLFKNNWLTAAGLLLALPTAYFIISSVLKFEMNVEGPYDMIAPIVEGRKLGWNINLLIAFGPVLAILLTIFQVLRIEFRFTREDFRLNLSVRKKWFPLAVIAFAGCLLAMLVLYLAVDNCTC